MAETEKEPKAPIVSLEVLEEAEKVKAVRFKELADGAKRG